MVMKKSAVFALAFAVFVFLAANFASAGWWEDFQANTPSLSPQARCSGPDTAHGKYVCRDPGIVYQCNNGQWINARSCSAFGNYANSPKCKSYYELETAEAAAAKSCPHAPAPQYPTTRYVRVKVQDSVGTAVESATVKIFSSGNLLHTLTTNNQGITTAAVSLIAGNEYALEVSKTNYDNRNVVMTVPPGTTTWLYDAVSISPAPSSPQGPNTRMVKFIVKTDGGEEIEGASIYLYKGSSLMTVLRTDSYGRSISNLWLEVGGNYRTETIKDGYHPRAISNIVIPAGSGTWTYEGISLTEIEPEPEQRTSCSGPNTPLQRYNCRDPGTIAYCNANGIWVNAKPCSRFGDYLDSSCKSFESADTGNEAAEANCRRSSGSESCSQTCPDPSTVACGQTPVPLCAGGPCPTGTMCDTGKSCVNGACVESGSGPISVRAKVESSTTREPVAGIKVDYVSAGAVTSGGLTDADGLASPATYNKGQLIGIRLSGEGYNSKTSEVILPTTGSSVAIVVTVVPDSSARGTGENSCGAYSGAYFSKYSGCSYGVNHNTGQTQSVGTVLTASRISGGSSCPETTCVCVGREYSGTAGWRCTTQENQSRLTQWIRRILGLD